MAVLYFIIAITIIICIFAPFVLWAALNFSKTLDNMVHNKWPLIFKVFIASLIIMLICVGVIILIVLI